MTIERAKALDEIGFEDVMKTSIILKRKLVIAVSLKGLAKIKLLAGGFCINGISIKS